MVLGGITSSMRNAIKDLIVARGKTLYIYPQLYEGKECTPYLFCTGPTPAQQCDEFIPWLIKNGGKKFALPSANYVWPHTLNVYARKVIEANGGEVVFEEYYPLDQIDFSSTVEPHHLQQGRRRLQHRHPAGRRAVLQAALRSRLPQERRAAGLRLLRREHAQHQPGRRDRGARQLPRLLQGADAGRSVQREAPGGLRKAVPGQLPVRRRQCRDRHLSRPEAVGSRRQGSRQVSIATRSPAALDHAKIAEGPGGPAEMVPGKRHCKMKMYTAVAKGGNYEIVARSAGLVDPKEC